MKNRISILTAVGGVALLVALSVGTLPASAEDAVPEVSPDTAISTESASPEVTIAASKESAKPPKDEKTEHAPEPVTHPAITDVVDPTDLPYQPVLTSPEPGNQKLSICHSGSGAHWTYIAPDASGYNGHKNHELDIYGLTEAECLAKNPVAFVPYATSASWLLPASWPSSQTPTYQAAIFPQDRTDAAPPCNRWVQADNYWIENAADEAVWLSLGDVLTQGEDSSIYASHQFIYGGDCIPEPPHKDDLVVVVEGDPDCESETVPIHTTTAYTYTWNVETKSYDETATSTTVDTSRPLTYEEIVACNPLPENHSVKGDTTTDSVACGVTEAPTHTTFTDYSYTRDESGHVVESTSTHVEDGTRVLDADEVVACPVVIIPQTPVTPQVAVSVDKLAFTGGELPIAQALAALLLIAAGFTASRLARIRRTRTNN